MTFWLVRLSSATRMLEAPCWRVQPGALLVGRTGAGRRLERGAQAGEEGGIGDVGRKVGQRQVGQVAMGRAQGDQVDRFRTGDAGELACEMLDIDWADRAR